MALPVLRVGPLQWIADLQRIPEKYLLYKIELTEIEREKLEEQRKFDLFIQNIIGPYCIRDWNVHQWD
jgi:hypothetical protein